MKPPLRMTPDRLFLIVSQEEFKEYSDCSCHIYAWARAKDFGCHSLCLSYWEITLRSSNLNIARSAATSVSPLMGSYFLSYLCI